MEQGIRSTKEGEQSKEAGKKEAWLAAHLTRKQGIAGLKACDEQFKKLRVPAYVFFSPRLEKDKAFFI